MTLLLSKAIEFAKGHEGHEPCVVEGYMAGVAMVYALVVAVSKDESMSQETKGEIYKAIRSEIDAAGFDVKINVVQVETMQELMAFKQMPSIDPKDAN